MTTATIATTASPSAASGAAPPGIAARHDTAGRDVPDSVVSSPGRRPAPGDRGESYVPPDPTLIDPSPASLEFWSNTLGVSPEALAGATGRVGPDLERVKTELGVGGVG